MNHKLSFSIVFALIVWVISYTVGNTSYPLAGEAATYNKLTTYSKMLGMIHDSIPTDILLVNVCYDKVQVPYEEDGMKVGTITATDRAKLLHMLKAIKEDGRYKYVMLDVNFEDGINTPYDSALFGLIKEMPRIVIPRHSDCILADSTLLPKTAYADFSTTWKAKTFSRFQFLQQDGVESMPLHMFREMHGHNISKWGPFYLADGKPCRNGVTLNIPLHISGEFNEVSGHLDKNYLYMGVDLVDIDSIIPIGEQTADKIVVCGDFANDRHETYVGPQPGSLICVNAYYALLRGDHIINWFVELCILLVYIIMTYFLIIGMSLKKLVSHVWLKILLLFFGVGAVFTTVSVVAYLGFGFAFNPVIPSTFYGFLALGLNIVNTYQTAKAQSKEQKNK